VCPFPDCGKSIETEETNTIHDSETDMNEEEVEIQVVNQTDSSDGISHSSTKKRTNENTVTSSTKKTKQNKNEDSRVLKKLIQELSVGTPKVSEVKEKESLFRVSQQEGDANTRIFFSLYYKITNAEDSHEISNQELIRCLVSML